jgi:DNA/RNA endonuclease YhcR with UshA esterase domain
MHPHILPKENYIKIIYIFNHIKTVWGNVMKFKYVIIVIACVSTAALYLLSLVSHPPLVPLSDLQRHNGQRVLVQGVVTNYRTTDYGNQIVTIRDTDNPSYRVTVYIEGELPINYDDTIQATGEVQQYKGQWELVVPNPQLITILQQRTNQSTPLWYLAEHPTNYLDTTVQITGIVAEKHPTSCTLTDPTGAYSIEIFYDTDHPHEFLKDDFVSVAARVLYEPTLLQFILKTTDTTHGIWRMEEVSDA